MPPLKNGCCGFSIPQHPERWKIQSVNFLQNRHLFRRLSGLQSPKTLCGATATPSQESSKKVGKCLQRKAGPPQIRPFVLENGRDTCIRHAIPPAHLWKDGKERRTFLRRDGAAGRSNNTTRFSIVKRKSGKGANFNSNFLGHRPAVCITRHISNTIVQHFVSHSLSSRP